MEPSDPPLTNNDSWIGCQLIATKKNKKNKQIHWIDIQSNIISLLAKYKIIKKWNSQVRGMTEREVQKKGWLFSTTQWQKTLETTKKKKKNDKKKTIKKCCYWTFHREVLNGTILTGWVRNWKNKTGTLQEEVAIGISRLTQIDHLPPIFTLLKGGLDLPVASLLWPRNVCISFIARISNSFNRWSRDAVNSQFPFWFHLICITVLLWACLG